VKEILPFIIAGLATGSIYGLAGTGLVLTYKTSGIFNFGYGALATAAAYVFYFLHYDHGLDWKLSFLISVFILGPLLGLLMEVIAKRLAPQNTAAKIVGTVGLILVVQGLGTIKYGTDISRTSSARTTPCASVSSPRCSTTPRPGGRRRRGSTDSSRCRRKRCAR
jgi:branched-subunit amino acid ABC-type transport system permease component